jgi:hypothetical protein
LRTPSYRDLLARKFVAKLAAKRHSLPDSGLAAKSTPFLILNLNLRCSCRGEANLNLNLNLNLARFLPWGHGKGFCAGRG